MSFAIKSGFEHIIITGGDPLHPAMLDQSIELADKAKQQGISVAIDTSLAISNEARVERLVGSNYDMFFVSCDSHIEDVQNSQRGKWQVTVDNINRLVKSGCNVTINCIVTRNNANHIREIWNYFKALGVVDIDFNIAFLKVGEQGYDQFSCEKMDDASKRKLIEDFVWCAQQSDDYARKCSHVLLQGNHFFGITLERETSFLGSLSIESAELSFTGLNPYTVESACEQAINFLFENLPTCYGTCLKTLLPFCKEYAKG